MGLFEHIHIKSHTAGSSNELSFDVLRKASGEGSVPPPVMSGSPFKGKGGSINLSKVDAAREAAANAYAKSKGKTDGSRKGNPFTTGSNGQSYVLSGSAEVARRKKARRGLRLITSVIGGLVIILLLCGGIFLNDRIHQDRMSFKSRLTNLTMQLASIDKDLVAIDQLTVNPLYIDDYEQIESLLGEMPGIMTSLVSIEDQAQEIRETRPAGYNAEALDELDASVQARIDMLSSAARLFELSSQAGNYIEEADEVWVLVVEAAQEASDAAWLANQASTPEAFEENTAILQGAINDLSTALRKLEFMKTNLGNEALSLYINYVTTKRRALQCAVDTNNALLELDRNKAQEANDDYLAAESEASDQASLISQSISDLVREIYQTRIENAQSSYESARESVIDADFALRQRIA